MYQVKDVAELSGVSVRTLHHYDEIGLLKPSKVGENGYRYYDDNNLIQLQQILFFKELGFTLKNIKEIVTSDNFNQLKALKNHRELLEKKKHRLNRLIETVNQTIEQLEGGIEMSKDGMFDAFDMSEIEAHQEKYAKETREKYGHTDAYKESQRRTSKYSDEDWERIKEESDSIYKSFVSLMDLNPDDENVLKIVEDFRRHISENFYDCPPEMLRGLGDLYINDPRFTKNIDKYAEGLAAFMREAFHAYADWIESK